MSSKTPSDDFTPTMGKNYLLEGYDFDEEYGDGVLDEARLPEAYGLGGLPDGIVNAQKLDVPEGVDTAEEDGFDLTGMDLVGDSGLPQSTYQEDAAHADKVPDVTDFTWLDDVEQDPGRLPSLATNRVIPELVEAWGRRTDGVRRIEATDLEEVKARAGDTPTSKVSDADLRRVLASAMRRSADGIPVDQIRRELVQLLGHEASRLSKPMKAIEAEHGLVGNVYLRPSAFPGLIHGKWAKEIKQRYKRARYLIACGQCSSCKGGTPAECACNSHLGLKVVEKVDWDRAYREYAPWLETTGRLDRTAKVSDKRATLKDAFLRHAKNTSPRIQQQFPTDKVPEPSVSPEQAREAFAHATVEREVVDPADSQTPKQRKEMQRKLGQWVKGRLLTAQEVKSLLESETSPRKVLRKAARIIVARKQEGAYTGDGRMPDMATPKEAFDALRAQGAEHRARQAAQETKQPRGENIRQVGRLLRWARQQMSEGFLGKDLSDLLAGKFSPRLLKDAADQIVQVRKKHEGLSGRLYVDAAAYASANGTAGCEDGARVHRTNAIPSVLFMPRCSSCVSRSQMEDGTHRCQKYNKPIVPRAPVDNPVAYQAEQIRLANASDAEITAAMFSPAEFNLHNAVLDDIEIDEGPPVDKLAEYTFGSLEWEDE